MSEYFDEANETLEQFEMLIGKESALKVYKLFEGENRCFPKRISLAELHNQIYAELQEGKNYGEPAEKYGYSKSYIRKIERKIIQKRRVMRKAGGTPPEPAAALKAKPVKTSSFTKSQDNACPRARAFEQGELFYDGQ